MKIPLTQTYNLKRPFEVNQDGNGRSSQGNSGDGPQPSGREDINDYNPPTRRNITHAPHLNSCVCQCPLTQQLRQYYDFETIQQVMNHDPPQCCEIIFKVLSSF
ncbi:hypothetical protein E2C01_088289 [Portunus trituberculatus]|uniref:Uncharacterized protein n=1 Tax=Portunus trituberculatus TaxID=210409 RepID=A0A5B7JIZ6_PORTR|nr:hypothetical protein [Portunus trituberculatus]